MSLLIPHASAICRAVGFPRPKTRARATWKLAPGAKEVRAITYAIGTAAGPLRLRAECSCLLKRDTAAPRWQVGESDYRGSQPCTSATAIVKERQPEPPAPITACSETVSDARRQVPSTGPDTTPFRAHADKERGHDSRPASSA
eukprot:354545-Chlamydomonas_euryale.AAC.6